MISLALTTAMLLATALEPATPATPTDRIPLPQDGGTGSDAGSAAGADAGAVSPPKPSPFPASEPAPVPAPSAQPKPSPFPASEPAPSARAKPSPFPASEPAPVPTAPAAPPAASPNVFNPRLTVVGDGLYRYDSRAVFDRAGNRVDGRFLLREAELDMRVAVDPFADGVAIISLGQTRPGQFEAEVEEGYVDIKRLPISLLDQPPLGLSFKVGRFRAETGRVNRLHLHDLPQPTRPLAIEEFFGEDGYLADGISAHVFLPFPFDDESAVELVGQALTGGGAAVAGGSSYSPAFVGNLRWFRTFADSHNLDLALIFFYGRTDPEGKLSAYTYSVDFLYKWRPLRLGEFHSLVFGAQALMSRRRFVDTGSDTSTVEKTSKPWGGFVFAQVQLARPLYLGVRADDTRTIRDDSLGRRAVGGYLTWYPSEFLRFRAGYEHLWSDLSDENSHHSAFAQLDFVMGAHPPEPFWVNK